MNRKLISLVTSVSLCASMSAVPFITASAAPSTLHDLIVDHFDGLDPVTSYKIKLDDTKSYLIQESALEVPTDMQVKQNTDEDWQNSYAVYGASATEYLFDYKTVMEMQTVKDLYDTYISAAKNLINVGYNNDQTLLDQLEKVTVQGQYYVTVQFPNATMYSSVASGDLSTDTVQTWFKLTKGDQSADLDKLYKVSKVETDESTNKMVITLDVTDGSNASTAEASKASLDTYLNYDIQIAKDKVSVPGPTGVYTMVGTVTGYTDIMSGTDKLAHVDYEAVQAAATPDETDPQDIAATVTLVETTQSPSPSPTPYRSSGGGGGGGSRATATPTVAPTATPDSGTATAEPTTVPTYAPEEMVPAPDKLESDNHFEYIIGYEDGTVRPTNSISREEVATIFYRLLKTTVRQELFTHDNNFSDVENDRWSDNAISTLANGGILVGYTDGTFRPANKITRAEFVTVAGRFYEILNFPHSDFTDIANHWAETNIDEAAYYKLIDGYSDGTFRPDAEITRAEVMTIINHILNREVDEEGLIDGARQWSDNNEGDWYYYTVIEATTPHDYERRIANQVMENWTKIDEDTDWEALEKTWTTGTEVDTNVVASGELTGE